MKTLARTARQFIPLIAIIGTYAWSIASISSRRVQESPAGTITLRIGHWQLESGVRDAFARMADEYSKLHPDVRIVQEAIPESTYGQWLITQLMGGTAPNIVEAGMLPESVLISSFNRYFVPLTATALRPNPHNRETDLRNVPLRRTYKDGMRSAYVDEMQEYMTIPLTQLGVRVFYNKDLLEKLTGRREAPTEYRAFLAACEQIASRQNDRGESYIPIAGSKYHFGMWETMMFNPLTYPAVRVADLNRDGSVGGDELFVAYSTGRIDFTFAAFRARLQIVREITSQFQRGYTGLTRDEALFLFAQQRAVFITTGTWDARSLEEQARGSFQVGVMDFPRPTRDDAEYGSVIEGPAYDAPAAGFQFGLTRACKHPEIALDFLLFMAGKEKNQELNRIIGWIPAIQGAHVDPLLAAFEPHLEGVYGAMPPTLGGETYLKWTQLYALFQVNQIAADDLIHQYGDFYREHGLRDFRELQRDWKRGMQSNEQLLAGIRAKAMANDDGKSDHWIRYRTLSASRQLWPEIDHRRQIRILDAGNRADAVGPYAYSAHAMERIRARVAEETRAHPQSN